MFSRLQKHFGAAGLIVSIVALSVALTSGANAASNPPLSSKQKKEVKKIAKGVPGPPGPAGKDGSNGSAGAKGDTGAIGPIGSPGPAGPKGDQGPKGATGATGPDGSPWTAGGVLPPGKTETGAWAFGELTAAAAPGVFTFYRMPISFTLPLPGGATGGLAATNVHYVNKNGKEMENLVSPTEAPSVSTVCTGSAANPTAAAGHLCVYEGSFSGGTLVNESITKLDASESVGTSAAGAWLGVFSAGAGARGWGSWAVTAAGP